LPSAARRSRNELISAWNVPASSCLGCRERGRGAVMAVALFPVAHHPQPSVSAGERFQSITRTGKCPAGPRPRPRQVSRGGHRVPRWLHSGRRRTTDRVGGAAPACRSACPRAEQPYDAAAFIDCAALHRTDRTFCRPSGLACVLDLRRPAGRFTAHADVSALSTCIHLCLGRHAHSITSRAGALFWLADSRSL
jgi:hypothetical protein